jgi:hypothetical protein
MSEDKNSEKGKPPKSDYPDETFWLPEERLSPSMR